MGVHLILSLTRAWVWQTGVLDRLDKISGCSVSGSGRRKQCNSPAYLIALDAITLCNINQCLESTGGVSMKGILDKRIGLPLAVSVKIPLSHRVHISPIQATKMNTSIFCRNTSQQINQIPGLKSWSPLMLALLVLLQWLTGRVIKEVSFLGLSWTDFSPLGPVQFFSRGLWKENFEEPPFWWTGVGQVCTLCRIILKELYKKILKLLALQSVLCFLLNIKQSILKSDNIDFVVTFQKLKCEDGGGWDLVVAFQLSGPCHTYFSSIIGKQFYFLFSWHFPYIIGRHWSQTEVLVLQPCLP